MATVFEDHFQLPEEDMYHIKCEICDKGRYQETSQHDDWDGVLHCPNCKHQVDRWRKEIPSFPN